MINRELKHHLLKSKKSLLIIGPRQTGKSTLVGSLKPDLTINFAHEATYLDFLRDPELLEKRISILEGDKTVFIDEVQRIPSILNTIQVILDNPKNKIRFYLTGSSARKLKRGNANLLPGRLHSYRLGPVTSGELGFKLDVSKVLSTGSLPGILTENDAYNREKTLRSYAGTYLKEEIQAENLARNIEGFARFLQIAAAWSGKYMDLSKISSGVQVARQSVVRFFEILEDSLVIILLNAFSKSLSRRLIQHPKYYFFDIGVLNGILGNFQVSQDRMGMLFEHLIVTQIFHSMHHHDREYRFSNYRTEHGAEVDVIIENSSKLTAVEVKASKNIKSYDLRGLKSFREYTGKKHRSIVLYQGAHKLKLEGVEIFPWQEGLKELLK